MARLGQGMFQGADNEAAHLGRIAETHLGLGRMYIHIHRTRFHFKKESQAWDGGRGPENPDRRHALHRSAAYP